MLIESQEELKKLRFYILLKLKKKKLINLKNTAVKYNIKFFFNLIFSKFDYTEKLQCRPIPVLVPTYTYIFRYVFKVYLAGRIENTGIYSPFCGSSLLSLLVVFLAVSRYSFMFHTHTCILLSIFINYHPRSYGKVHSYITVLILPLNVFLLFISHPTNGDSC